MDIDFEPAATSFFSSFAPLISSSIVNINSTLDNPELRALVDKVIARSKHKMTPEEIDAWAKRLAADVADLAD